MIELSGYSKSVKLYQPCQATHFCISFEEYKRKRPGVSLAFLTLSQIGQKPKIVLFLDLIHPQLPNRPPDHSVGLFLLRPSLKTTASSYWLPAQLSALSWRQKRAEDSRIRGAGQGARARANDQVDWTATLTTMDQYSHLSPAEILQLISEYKSAMRDFQASRFASAAAITLYVYDIFLTFGREVSISCQDSEITTPVSANPVLMKTYLHL
jgi:hypothetical protein